MTSLTAKQVLKGYRHAKTKRQAWESHWGEFNRGREGQRYKPDPFGRLGQGRWVDDKPKTSLVARQKKSDLPKGFIFNPIKSPIGKSAPNRSQDIKLVETLLGKSGHLDLKQTDGPTGYFGTRLKDAIKGFQKDKGLKVDGVILPKGETFGALKESSGTTAVPARQKPKETQIAGGPINLLNRLATSPVGKQALRQGEKALKETGKWISGATALGKAAEEASKEKRNDYPTAPIASASAPEKNPSRSARTEVLDEAFIKELSKPVESNVGDEYTQEGNRIYAEECRKVLDEEFSEHTDRVKHVGGSYKNGKGDVKRDGKKGRLSEKYIPNPDSPKGSHRGASHADLTWEFDGKKNPRTQLHLNTMTTWVDGVTPTAGERRSLESLTRKVKKGLAHGAPKLRPHMDKEEFRKNAKKVCQEIFKDAFEEWLKEDPPEDDRS